MHLFDHLRWHPTLLSLGRGRRYGARRMRTSQQDLAAPAPHDAAQVHQTPYRIGTRLPLRLVRLLGAACDGCRGIGCGVCERTGLR